MSTSKPSKGIPVASKIPSSGRDSGTHSRSSSVSNLTTASDIHSEVGDAMSENTHGFKVDDRVWVNGTKPGIVKFLGKTQFAPGLWAGIILDDPVGKNDGSVAGIKYFSCEPLKGIFARPAKLSASPGGSPTTSDSSRKRSTTPRAAYPIDPLSCYLTGSTTSLSSARSICSRLKCGERVMVSSTSGMKAGILRYYGVTDFAKGEWAGIELDEPVGKNDGSVAGKRYFSCKMKYGLFSPMHKVSRAGGTSTPRTPSVRGTPLMRSTSRDSISSSVSNSSKASKTSRVKLGITSLTNSQLKARATGGIGIMTTSRALEEALREKEQHIEQLLKEHDIERTEIAKVASRCEELETKCNELVNQQQHAEKNKENIEQQLLLEKRKLEDLQFQLEEEKIVKSDLEMQMSNHKQLVQRLEEFLNKKLNINIREILEGKEKLSDIPDKQPSDPQIEMCNKKIASLEASLTSSVAEKDESLKKLEDVNLLLLESKKENQNLLSSSNTTIQEKDDVISNLKSELSAQLEKLTNYIEENKNLNDQINLQAAEAKGQTDEVIKEMGEKIKSLAEELNAKSIRLQESEISIQEKESKLSDNSNSLQTQTQQLAEIQNQNEILQGDLEQKNSELIEQTTVVRSLEEEISSLKSRLNTETSKKEEKILGLVKELESKTNQLQETEDKLTQNQTEVSILADKVKDMSEVDFHIQEKLKEKEEQVSSLTKDSSEKVCSLQAEINLLTQEKTNAVDKLEKKLSEIQEECEKLTKSLNEKVSALTEKEEALLVLQNQVKDKETDVSKTTALTEKLKQELDGLAKDKQNIIEENRKQLQASREEYNLELKKKDQLLFEFEEQIIDLKSSKEKGEKDIVETKKEVKTLQAALKRKNEGNIELKSKLQLAEQNVEMLNKDSSQHVMELQSELSKLKEESIKNKTAFDQKLSELQDANAKMSKDVIEKNSVVIGKDVALSELKEELNTKEIDNCNLSKQIKSLQKGVNTLAKGKEELKISHEKQIKISKEQFESQIKIKDIKLSEIQEECEKLTKSLNEKVSALTEKEEALLVLQNQVKDKETDVSKTTALTEKLKQELDVLAKDKQNIIQENRKQLQASREEYNLELKKKDQRIEESQSEILASSKLLESKDKELLRKETKNNALKNALLEKESQFDEMKQVIENSQAQLKQLTEQHQSNVKLLDSKEVFINDFKVEREKQLLELKENFKAEASKLQDLLQKRESDIKEKSDIISKLNSEADNQMKEIKCLSEELIKSKELNEKSVLSSSEINKEFTAKISELEAKYSQVLEEKKRIEAEEQKTRETKKTLEETKDSLLQEKVQTAEIVKDREAKLEALQVEVNRMQTNFTLHKQELQQKLDVSQLELEAAQELKKQLELQHSVLEELQQELHNSEENCKNLEAQLKNTSVLTSEKSVISSKLAELEKLDKEKNEKITDITEKYQSLEETLKNNQSSLSSKEKECLSLNEKLQVLQAEKASKELLQKSLKLLEQENILLKHQMEKLEKSQTEKNANESVSHSINQDDVEERETLQSQIDFLNSIIVDMRQKNEHLQLEVEALKMSPADIDLNLNMVEKKLAPRLFCDICDEFDLHDTDDCPKQESFIADEEVPHLMPHGSRKLEERPYCNTCEAFGHWTFDCQEEDEY